MVALRSTKLIRTTRKSMFIGPLFFAVAGSIFVFDGARQDNPWNFASTFGAAFILFALACLVVNLRAFGGKDKA